MQSSFMAYIDESGDDGFVFNADGTGSSKWFVLSAIVVRRENDAQLRQAAKSARAILQKPEKHPLHFVKLNHSQRIAVCSLLPTLAIRIISVLTHKPSVIGTDYASKKNSLYHYVTRLLLERISWLCRDTRKTGSGDGTVDLVFSNRSSMSYEELRRYLRALKSRSDELDVRIAWKCINPDNVSAESHEKLAGLQLADFAASGTRFAAELSRYGYAESGYIKKMKPILYRRGGTLFGYGLKFYPDLEKLKPANPHLSEFAGL